MTEILSAADTQVERREMRRREHVSEQVSANRLQYGPTSDADGEALVVVEDRCSCAQQALSTSRHRAAPAEPRTGVTTVGSEGRGVTHLRSWSSMAHRERCWDDTANTPNRRLVNAAAAQAAACSAGRLRSKAARAAEADLRRVHDDLLKFSLLELGLFCGS